MTRRSVRRYKPDPIAMEDLQEILAAGAAAPSAINLQHWYFVAVQSPDALEEVKAIMGGVVEKFTQVLEQRFARNPEQVGITNKFLSTLGGAPVCVRRRAVLYGRARGRPPRNGAAVRPLGRIRFFSSLFSHRMDVFRETGGSI